MQKYYTLINTDNNKIFVKYPIYNYSVNLINIQFLQAFWQLKGINTYLIESYE